MTISHDDIKATHRTWPHHPATPTPAVTVTARQAQQILRSLASGFTSVVELEWIAEQLGPDHIAHPTESSATIAKIIDALNRQAAQDRDLYRRGYYAGRADGETIARDQTWGEGYAAGYDAAQRRDKANPAPPDTAAHPQIAML